ncbi:type IV pilus modification protein PilV [Calidifontimicrobium sp. SYSU G02091]|uniref:type IV pilus modification protein PilV n=1 Tax=Calidifontimicrobium sp. SYSU G02091 TaxID=2926421 RepID=UPI001F536D6D|nr:type IV pilus modification protein PilV [Calidifontimicrobium sp. SYSU G02091]
MKAQRVPRRLGQTGVALIEVLVALIILAFGILGVVGLQASMTRAQTSSTFRAEAAFLAQRLIGDMWADRANLAGYDTSACEAACEDYLRLVAARLPRGESTVTVNTATGAVTIEIRWTPPGEDTNRFTTATAITNS